MAKTCPKCGETVANRKWMYMTKMCRKCDYKYRTRPRLIKEGKIKSKS